jgi:hypothetical protein
MTHPAYEKLLEELAKGQLNELQRNIYKLLKEHKEGLTREQLVMQLFGYYPGNLNDNTDVRKIRKAIETMRKRLFPIVSTSTKAGYRLDISREAVLKMIRELQARKEHIQDQIDAAAKFYELPPEYREPVQATQGRLA